MQNKTTKHEKNQCQQNIVHVDAQNSTPGLVSIDNDY